MSSSDLATYSLQLQQVEAALTSDPGNPELLKLKEDLSQVISLTRDLIEQQMGGGGSRMRADDDEEEDDEEDEGAASSSAAVAAVPRKFVDDLQPVKHWQVGEQCQALYNKDGNYYEATINEITTDGEACVTFRHNKQQGVTSLGLLKISKSGITGSTSSASRKEQLAKQKEYLKKRKAKKLERFQNMEKERETEKNKWQNFSNKAFGKKGFVKKSIFKTPENSSGRVGVGTCGISGTEMTKYSNAMKHKKGP